MLMQDRILIDFYLLCCRTALLCALYCRWSVVQGCCSCCRIQSNWTEISESPVCGLWECRIPTHW